MKSFLRHFITVLVFVLVTCLLFFASILLLDKTELLKESNLLKFDAELYKLIRDQGYAGSWLCAFFPAFPFIWKLLGLSIIGVSLFNLIVYAISAATLSMVYNFSLTQRLFYLSIPSLVFMYVPYSESLFFATTALILVGLKKNNTALTSLGLFLCSLVRPTAFIFGPAILLTFFLASRNKKQLPNVILFLISLLAGLMTTVTIHYFYSHEWFVFFESQKLWKNYLHFPTLPFTSWGGDSILRLDGMSLAIAIFAGIYALKLIWIRFQQKYFEEKDVSFSLFYLIGTALVVVLFRDGNLYSINRFIFATPFVVISIHHFFTTYQFKMRDLWIMLLSTEIFWLFFNSYTHIHNFLLFTGVSVYLCLLLLSTHKNKVIANAVICILILVNTAALIKLGIRFLNGGWIA